MGNCCLRRSLSSDITLQIILKCMTADAEDLADLFGLEKSELELPHFLIDTAPHQSSTAAGELHYLRAVKVSHYALSPGGKSAVNLLFAVLFAFENPIVNGKGPALSRQIQNKREYLFSRNRVERKEDQDVALTNVVKNILHYSCNITYNGTPFKLRFEYDGANGKKSSVFVSPGVHSILQRDFAQRDALNLCARSDFDIPLEVFKLLLDAVQKEAPGVLESYRCLIEYHFSDYSTTIPLCVIGRIMNNANKDRVHPEEAKRWVSMLLDYSELDFSATSRDEKDPRETSNVLHSLCSMSKNALPILELLISASRITPKMLRDKFLSNETDPFKQNSSSKISVDSVESVGSSFQEELGSGHHTFFQLAARKASSDFVGECVTQKLFRDEEDLVVAFFYACGRESVAKEKLDKNNITITHDEKCNIVAAILSGFRSRNDAIASLKNKKVKFVPAFQQHGRVEEMNCVDIALWSTCTPLMALLLANGLGPEKDEKIQQGAVQVLSADDL